MTSRRSSSLILTSLAILLVCLAAPARAGIWTTKHNLSSGGSGTIKSTTETRVCVFCHVPHNSQPATPLWGHKVNTASYTIYTSSTIQGSTGQPNGSSKLCLGCHDGAVAVGAVVPSYRYPAGSPAISMAGTATGGVLPPSPRVLGTDLSNDHPVSLTPASGAGADPEIVTALPVESRVQYDQAGRVQCTSCHDPHDNTNGKFLVQPNLIAGFGSQLCLPCHAKADWTLSSHRNSTKVYGSLLVKEQGCTICHKPHSAPVATRLVAGSEEGLCNNCHNGSASVTPAIKNIAGEFLLPYKHPTDTIAAKHDPAETDPALNDPLQRHAECADCHNPHGASPGTHTQGSSRVGAVLVGAWGLKPIYSAIPMSEPVSWQKVVFTNTTDADMLEAYLCFKCHKSLAKFFNPNNPSYHAAVGSSKADTAYTVPYINGWTPTSRMTCTDCHTSSNGSIKGPHGSSYAENAHPRLPDWTIISDPAILFADYIRGGGHGNSGSHWTVRGTGGTQDGYGVARNSDNDLCFRCHDRRVYGHATDTTFKNDPTSTGYRGPVDTWFNSTNWHLTHMKGKACTTCHQVHGSNKPHLLATDSDSFALNARLSGYYITPASVPPGGTWNYIACHGGSYTGC